jgi:hypothetical protein
MFILSILDVFQRLRTLKGRKTTRIFITHRFGHLTRHADLILYVEFFYLFHDSVADLSAVVSRRANWWSLVVMKNS